MVILLGWSSREVSTVSCSYFFPLTTQQNQRWSPKREMFTYGQARSLSPKNSCFKLNSLFPAVQNIELYLLKSQPELFAGWQLIHSLANHALDWIVFWIGSYGRSSIGSGAGQDQKQERQKIENVSLVQTFWPSRAYSLEKKVGDQYPWPHNVPLWRCQLEKKAFSYPV